MVSTDDLAWSYSFHHLMACVETQNAPPNHL